MLVNPFLNVVNIFYRFFIKIGSNLQSIFLFYMRATWGHQFLLAGIKKLQNIEATAAFFTKLKIPSPIFHAYEVGIFETVAGTLIVIGLASRIAAIPLLIVMFIALGTAHAEVFVDLNFLRNPHTLASQTPYPYFITALLVFIFGPGRISLDAWIKHWVDHQPKY